MNLEKFLTSIRMRLLTLLDVMVVVFSYFFSLYIRFDFEIVNALQFIPFLFEQLPLIILVNYLIMKIFKLNKSLWQYVSIEESLRIVFCVTIANMIVGIYFNVFVSNRFPRSVYILATLCSICLMVGYRIAYRYYRLQVRSSNRNGNGIIIGAGSAGNILFREITNNEKYEYKIIGFVDDANFKIGRRIGGLEVLGSTDDLERIKNKYNIDVAYIAIPSADKAQLRSILKKCQEVDLQAKIMGMSELDQNGKSTVRNVSIEDLLGRGEIKLDTNQISEYLHSKTILVTGAGGSIGSELCRQILKFEPKQLIMLDIYENNIYNLQVEIDAQKRNLDLYLNTEVVTLIASVREFEVINNIMDKYKPDVVYHAAAHKHVPLMEDSPKEAIKNNIFGTKNVIQACINNQVSKFILISTDKAVNPTNVMGATKRMTELLLQSMKDNGVTTLAAVRFGNVLGSNGSVIPLFKKQIENGGPVTVTDPEIKRYFMTIPEASQLVLQAGSYASNGEIFVLDMGEPVKIVTLAENLIHLMGFKPYSEIKIDFVGLRPGEKMFEELAYNNSNFHKTENELIYVAEPEDVKEDKFNLALSLLDKEIHNCDSCLKDILLKVIFDNYS